MRVQLRTFIIVIVLNLFGSLIFYYFVPLLMSFYFFSCFLVILLHIIINSTFILGVFRPVHVEAFSERHFFALSLCLILFSLILIYTLILFTA